MITRLEGTIDLNPAIEPANVHIPDLENVGDYKLSTYYDKDFKPTYVKGDEVWAWVPENHLSSLNEKGFVLTKVRITEVNKFNPTETYWGSQIERGWSDDNEMILTTVRAGIGASFSEQDVVGKVMNISQPALAINNFVDEEGKLSEHYHMDKVINLEHNLEPEKTRKPKMK